jgi:transcriptional regulator with PAS, ATPase and Fis domain
MVEVVNLLKQVARADCNVLLTGESGTGKELAASLIHFHSRRSDGKLLAINCGGFTEDLLASELFGHEKGAFTGATTKRPGLLESASGGTLLLDEVGDMPLSMQVKLLRAIQEQEIIPVGGNEPLPIDVRILAATNQDLKKAVSAGLFRQDLYYRLNVVSLVIPPLRERKEDIPHLAHYFLHRAAARSLKKIRGFSDEAMNLIVGYSFPGNVRELENIVERAVAIAKEHTIQAWDLPPDLSEMDVFSFAGPDSRIKTLREMQRDYIRWVLDRVGRNKTRAAAALGIDRASLWRHLKRNEIQE